MAWRAVPGSRPGIIGEADLGRGSAAVHVDFVCAGRGIERDVSVEEGEFENTDQDQTVSVYSPGTVQLLSTVIMVKELLPQSGQHRRFCSSVVTRPCHFFCCCETCIVRHFFGCRRCDDRQHQNPFVFSSQLPNLVKPLTIMALSMDGELDSWPPRIFSSPSSTDADDWPLGWRRRKTLPVTHTRTRRATPLSADLRGPWNWVLLVRLPPLAFMFLEDPTALALADDDPQ